MSSIRFREIGRKIVCVGRNYKDHAAELNNPLPKTPLLFMKATSSYVSDGGVVKAPPGCKKLNQEVELGVVIGRDATNVSKASAMDHVAGYIAALDMTARDFQDEAKTAGNPWFLAKSFDTSCPVSKFVDKSEIPDPQNVELFCYVSGSLKQKANTSTMIFDIPTLISYASQFVTLQTGDVLLTGTPAGVTQIASGDSIKFGITDKVEAQVTVQY